jgi:hypothetical protein
MSIIADFVFLGNFAGEYRLTHAASRWKKHAEWEHWDEKKWSCCRNDVFDADGYALAASHELA